MFDFKFAEFAGVGRMLELLRQGFLGGPPPSSPYAQGRRRAYSGPINETKERARREHVARIALQSKAEFIGTEGGRYSRRSRARQIKAALLELQKAA